MKWFLNLPTQSKLFMGFGLIVVLLIASMLTASLILSEIQASQKALFGHDFTLVTDLMQLRTDLNRQQADIQQMMLTTNRVEQEATEKDLRNRDQEADHLTQELFQLEGNDANFLRRLQDLEGVRKDYKQTRDVQIAEIYDGKIEEARRLGLGIQAERYEGIRAIAMELGSTAKERARAAIVVSQQRSRESFRLFTFFGTLALLVAVVMVLVLSRVICTPIQEISGLVEQIAAGDLTVNLSRDQRADEIGRLAQTFHRMAGNLREQIRSLSEGVTVLGLSATQISSSTAQLAATSSETAAAVNQTTTTVEEVKQTAQVSSQKAKYVADSAQKATHVAQAGRQAVQAAIDGMERIRAQMESIAESVAKLSEQSQAIGEIIAAVNDLTEQSNLLAVNAAIEAAKAGEQGKGFAVVAHEVRSLAEQSKQATAQVRTILNDIQKATTAAVLATEQGSKAVEAGVKQSTEAGEAIRSLADSITEAAQAATQIAASSQQQLVGTDQVALAMENIKQASMQNVAGTKQAETAAHSLHELGQKLKRMVEQYQV